MKPIGVFGGTFDPVHNGHLRLALEFFEALDLEVVRLVPSNAPPHRAAPAAPAGLRLAMLLSAVQDEAALTVDDRELRRGEVSYTVDTLSDLRRELGDVPLCLLLGMDAFAAIHTWYRWTSLIQLAHFAVAHRPEASMPTEEEVLNLIDRHATDSSAELHNAPAGWILMRSIPQLDISASGIRSLIAAGRNPRYLLPDPVLDLIEHHGLYKPHRR